MRNAPFVVEHFKNVVTDTLLVVNMESEQSLNKISLENLPTLFSKSTEDLLKSKILSDDPEETARFQRLVELIQKVMIAKRAENDPMN